MAALGLMRGLRAQAALQVGQIQHLCAGCCSHGPRGAESVGAGAAASRARHRLGLPGQGHDQLWGKDVQQPVLLPGGRGQPAAAARLGRSVRARDAPDCNRGSAAVQAHSGIFARRPGHFRAGARDSRAALPRDRGGSPRGLQRGHPEVAGGGAPPAWCAAEFLGIFRWAGHPQALAGTVTFRAGLRHIFHAGTAGQVYRLRAVTLPDGHVQPVVWPGRGRGQPGGVPLLAGRGRGLASPAGVPWRSTFFHRDLGAIQEGASRGWWGAVPPSDPAESSERVGPVGPPWGSHARSPS
mmetsp:Transcript_71254/g.201977  ORF Transcript_71254/g.201977 Transcript_71254/m.201977 type:complete len:296 (-) Transcript_71254:1558-2445(-)